MSEIQGIAPPDTSPENALPIPSATPPHAPSIDTLKSWLPLYLSKSDVAIRRLDKILSTPSGTDRLLMTICYTSLLTSNVLSSISLARIQQTTRSLIEKAISLPPNTTLVFTPAPSRTTANLLTTSVRLKKLSALISDFRIFTRLWGLLGLYKWGKASLENPPEDTVLRRITYAQVFVNVLFQYLENAAYLSSKGIMGWDSKKQNRAWEWSSRFWAAHVGLDLGRLCYEWNVRRRRDLKGKEKDEGEVEQNDAAWRAKWRREMVVNLAYAPLTIHWSLEQGLIGEFWVGLFGSVAGVTALRELWRQAQV
ncbi:hypothetical protein BP6252_00728 [Coleophoma cylindrospora]|uniref:Peroxin 11C n=1 Tax=Coleophoma cylindrospora TaxID=1849047 RepID=A0A3D8SQV6_9HELO|nr:hypothetical protein BP6252_00728 [Coleophoma cylindrospora]